MSGARWAKGEGSAEVSRESMEEGSVNVMVGEVLFKVTKKDLAERGGGGKKCYELGNGHGLWDRFGEVNASTEGVACVENGSLGPTEGDESGADFAEGGS